MHHDKLINKSLGFLVEYLQYDYLYALDYYMVVIDNRKCMKLSSIAHDKRYMSMNIVNWERMRNGYMYWLDVE